jgi:hypothetical protein
LTLNEEAEQLELLRPLVRRAARSVAFQWPGVVDVDDVEQEIMLRLWESPGSVEKIREMEDRAKYRAVVGIGHQLASAERASYDYYKGSYRYSVAEIKDVLKRGVLVCPLGGFDEATHDLIEALMALAVKTPQYFDAITKRYADHLFPANTREKDALKNGLTSLADGMNKANKRRFSERDDGPGTRKAISNAKAQYIATSQYSGDGEGDF